MLLPLGQTITQIIFTTIVTLIAVYHCIILLNQLLCSSVDCKYMRAAAEYICCQRQQTFKNTVNATFISIEFSSWARIDWKHSMLEHKVPWALLVCMYPLCRCSHYQKCCKTDWTERLHWGQILIENLKF